MAIEDSLLSSSSNGTHLDELRLSGSKPAASAATELDDDHDKNHDLSPQPCPSASPEHEGYPAGHGGGCGGGTACCEHAGGVRAAAGAAGDCGEACGCLLQDEF